MIDIQKASEANMLFHMTYFTKFLPNMELISEPDVTVVRTKIFDDTFNYVIFAKFTKENVSQRVSHVLRLFKSQKLPFSWWVGTSDSPTHLTKVLLDHGLTFKEEDVGMSLDLSKCLHNCLNTSLHFHQIQTLEGLKEFSLVLIDIGGNPQIFDLIYRKIPLKILQKDAPLEMYVAYLDKKPVVTGVLVFHANIAGIYYIATVKNQRKKGFGTAMMKHLLHRAKLKGFSLATLQASHEGKNLYERLGFTECCCFREYSWKN